MNRNIRHFLPILDWLPSYSKDQLAGDLNAGAVTAVMLVPQGMAYAMLAGLPPELGLYASIVPLLLYAVFGSSRVLAVGPVALVSLLVAGTINDLGSSVSVEQMPAIAAQLALLVGIISIVLGLFRLGFIVNFISHQVISGFTSAAALIIALSQLKHLMGVEIPRTHNIFLILSNAFENLASVNIASLAIGVGGIAVLMFFKNMLGDFLARWGIVGTLRDVLTRVGPLVVVTISTVVVFVWGLDTGSGVRIVGNIPEGLPQVTAPVFDLTLLTALLPSAFLISFVGFVESVSVAKVLASRRRQKVGPNQELVGIGAANLGAALSGGYPVTGGFSRSSVNYEAGANTPLASVVTALLVALTVAFLTPLFYYLPKAVLASIIMVAVLTLVDFKTLKASWRYSKSDAFSLIGTFFAVLVYGVETGLAIGVGIAVVLYLWHTSRPHVAIIGRVPGTEHFRNHLRHEVLRAREVSAARIDESLFFANATWLEDWALGFVADNPDSKHLVLNCAATNFIDASALEVLERMDEELAHAGVTMHLAEIKGPVMDRLKISGFVEKIGLHRIHLSTHEAMKKLGYPI
ncbi:MAG: sulfate permease [Alphaproteobacteria bacterium]|jgi:sulfate permease, SulP family|nr:sulfate permease [Alphaproteobacteria bacterium]